MYHGPLRPDRGGSRKDPKDGPFVYDVEGRDVSFAAAYALGRVIAFGDSAILKELRAWRRNSFELVRQTFLSGDKIPSLGYAIENPRRRTCPGIDQVFHTIVKSPALSSVLTRTGEFALKPSITTAGPGGRGFVRRVMAPFIGLPAGLSSDPLATIRTDLTAIMGGEAGPGIDLVEPAKGAPPSLAEKLLSLRFLGRVPCEYLALDFMKALPDNSMRFFFVDREWTDALVEGALSAGATTTLDRECLKEVYPVVRRQLDEKECGETAPKAAVLCGFLLRSPIVSAWPDMTITAKGQRQPMSAAPPKPLADTGLLIRTRVLAPDTMIAVMDGVPTEVVLSEPVAAVHFTMPPDDPAFYRCEIVGNALDVPALYEKMRPNTSKTPADSVALASLCMRTRVSLVLKGGEAPGPAGAGLKGSGT
jgi:hypothetical protein